MRQAVVPEPLEVCEPLVRWEIMRMPDTWGFGDHTEYGQEMQVRSGAEPAEYMHAMYLDNMPALASGRVINAFPTVFSSPRLYIDSHALVGTLDYGSLRAARISLSKVLGMLIYARLAQTEQKERTLPTPSKMPIDRETRLYSPRRIAVVVQVLEEDGTSADSILKAAGLTRNDLDNPKVRVSAQQVVSVYRAVLSLGPDPTLALRAGSRMSVTAYGMYGYALLSGATLAEMNDATARYHEIVFPGVRLTGAHDERSICYQYDILLAPDPADALHRFVLEFGYAAHLAVGRSLHGPSFHFSEAQVMYAEPGHSSAYRILFDCPVQFNQPRNAVTYERSIAQVPKGLADTVTHLFAREQCEIALSSMKKPGGVAFAVRRVLKDQTPRRFTTIDAMASELLMEPRALRRRLELVGTSYRKILSDVRLQLAIDYLSKSRMTMEEIASQLGYSDAANFRHAFVRWTGSPPSKYRRHRTGH